MSENLYKDSLQANPLASAIYQREKLINNLEIFIGCTVGTFKKRSDESVAAIRGYADHIDEVTKKCSEAEYHICLTKVTCGAVTIGSLLLAPITGGTSLYTAVGASVVGAIAVCGAKYASGAILHCEVDLGEKAKVSSERVVTIIKIFHKVLTEYDEVLIKAKKFLKTSEGIMLCSLFKTSSEPTEITLRSFIAKAIKTFGSKTKLMEYILYIGQYGIASTTSMASSLFLSQAVDDGGLGIWKLFEQNPTQPKCNLFALKLREYAKSMEDSTEALLTHYAKCTRVENEGINENAQRQHIPVAKKINVATNTDKPSHQNNFDKKPMLISKLKSAALRQITAPDKQHVSCFTKRQNCTQPNICDESTIAVNHANREIGVQTTIPLPDKPRVTVATPQHKHIHLDSAKDRTERKTKVAVANHGGNHSHLDSVQDCPERKAKVAIGNSGYSHIHPDSVKDCTERTLKVTVTVSTLRDSNTHTDSVKDRPGWKTNVAVATSGDSHTHMDSTKNRAEKKKKVTVATLRGSDIHLDGVKDRNKTNLKVAVATLRDSHIHLDSVKDRIERKTKVGVATMGDCHIHLDNVQGCPEMMAKVDVTTPKDGDSVKDPLESLNSLRTRIGVLIDKRKIQREHNTRIKALITGNNATVWAKSRAEAEVSNIPDNPITDHVTKAHHRVEVDHCKFCAETNHTVDHCWHGKKVRCHSCKSLGHKKKFCSIDGGETRDECAD